MILADTSVWINHLRRSDQQLSRLLNHNQLLMHPFVTGELAIGSLHHRDAFLQKLSELPQAEVMSADNVLQFINRHALHGVGIDYIDVHLLAAAAALPGTRMWTADRRLHAACLRLGIAA